MTKLSPLILAFILALGAISAVALTLSSSVTQRLQVFSKGQHGMGGSAQALASNRRAMGDPIDDPIPNKNKK